MEDTLGLFAPDPDQGDDPPGPTIGDFTQLGKADKLRLPRWGYGKFEGFWPKKAREHPRGKVNFPSRMIPWLSPDAKHPDWRLRRRARSTTALSQTFRIFPRISGNKAIYPIQVISAIEVQETKSPGSGVQGAEQAPCLVFVFHSSHHDC